MGDGTGEKDVAGPYCGLGGLPTRPGGGATTWNVRAPAPDGALEAELPVVPRTAVMAVRNPELDAALELFVESVWPIVADGSEDEVRLQLN